MVLELNNVSKSYGDFRLSCSLELKNGCVTGLIGQNGAGKSTTFKAILNLINVDGSVKVFGKEADKLTVIDKENIGVVLSDSGFSGYLTINDIISIMQKMYHQFDRSSFINQCSNFRLPLDKKIKEFSSGMKAKTKILCALSHKAKLLVLDEPTAGLDVIARDELLDILRSYMEGNDECSIIISSHISTDLEGLCDDIYMIDNGKIVMHEDTDVLLSDYGVLKLTSAQYNAIDRKYIVRTKQEKFGYTCLTKYKAFYQENYPGIAVEKGNIDEVITLMIRGE